MKRSIRDLRNLKGKKVLVRVDFNVPMDRVGRILDITRIKAAVPTIQYLCDKGAKVILCTHLGRPEGFDINLSLWPISLILMKFFPAKVHFAERPVGEKVKEQIKALSNGAILLLENTRFYKEEKENDKNFAKELASIADIFVNEAFSVSHRKHASCYGVSRLLPNALGFLVEQEVEVIENLVNNPKKPFVAIFGGVKVESKIKIIENLLNKVNTILIGGAMAYPFLSAMKIPIGESYCTQESFESAVEILKKAKEKNVKIVLPVDHVAVKLNETKQRKYVVDILEINMSGRDIGPKTVELFKKEIKEAKQVFWNGPLGMFEDERFKEGTFKIAEIVSESVCYSVVGGGDSINAINQMGKAEFISHISTGGGASMKLLEGNSLPCVEIIQERVE